MLNCSGGAVLRITHAAIVLVGIHISLVCHENVDEKPGKLNQVQICLLAFP